MGETCHMTTTDSPLCPPCRAASSAWLGYRLPPALGIAYGSGADYDMSAAGIRDRRQARFELWRDTIRWNRDLIARTCRAAGHTTAEPAARVIQLDLLAELIPFPRQAGAHRTHLEEAS